ncbi:MAG: hypothetical protein JW891_08270 [Candidatus Lokiarchaeota archaeon]|nr:hypothetical protein [Candidatus Lokiarchaeota archaeon]
MITDVNYFLRRYIQAEDDFLDIMDYINITENWNDPCYKIGSSKLMDFCLKVCTEIETLFREILNSTRFDSHQDISRKRNNQNINVYMDVIEPVYELGKYSVFFLQGRMEIWPFLNFNTQTPEWFKIYSKYKHNKLELLKRWNIKASIHALSAFLILAINHPTIDGKNFISNSVFQRVLDLISARPRFSLPPT